MGGGHTPSITQRSRNDLATPNTRPAGTSLDTLQAGTASAAAWLRLWRCYGGQQLRLRLELVDLERRLPLRLPRLPQLRLELGQPGLRRPALFLPLLGSRGQLCRRGREGNRGRRVGGRVSPCGRAKSGDTCLRGEACQPSSAAAPRAAQLVHDVHTLHMLQTLHTLKLRSSFMTMAVSFSFSF